MERELTQMRRIFTDLKLTSSIDLIEDQKCLHLFLSVITSALSAQIRVLFIDFLFDTLKAIHVKRYRN